jgi:integrase
MSKQKRILKSSLSSTKSGVGFLKSPTAKSGRATFALIERREVDGKLQNTTIKSEALTAINTQFLQGAISYDRARILAKDLLDRLYPKQAILHNQANLDLLQRYWEKEYADRDLVDRRTAWNRLLRATEAAGHYSLLSASKEELQSTVDAKFKGNRQRDVVSALNQLLQFFKRDFKLRKAREEIKPISHITEAELARVITHLRDDKLKLMHQVAFATGLRAGELFGLQPEAIKTSSLFMSTQVDINKTRRELKNRRPREVFILPGYRELVLKWAQMPQEERNAFRRRSIAKYTRKASQAALGRSINFHALRHSYAICLVSRGVSLSLVSQFLGDSIKVTEKYYSGYVSTPDTIEYVKAILTGR